MAIALLIVNILFLLLTAVIILAGLIAWCAAAGHIIVKIT